MIRTLLGRFSSNAAGKWPMPDTPMVAVGDVHGRFDLVCELVEQISDWLNDTPKLVFLGDVIDRGPDSAAVIDLLRDLQAAEPGRVEVLMGNHEQMMLNFLDNTEGSEDWLKHGGTETLESFGISPNGGHQLRAKLRRALGPDRLAWLSVRPLYLTNGDVVAVHAAWENGVAPEDQDPKTLVWGTPAFYRKPRKTGPWVVHGHVITGRAAVHGRRIAMDTGAYLSDQLSAVRLEAGSEPRFTATGE